MTSSRFREKFLAALEHVANSVNRIVVGELPPQVQEWYEANRRALNLCKDDLSEDEQEAILKFFNGKWGGGWAHYCTPNCCHGKDDFCATPAPTVCRHFFLPVLYYYYTTIILQYQGGIYLPSGDPWPT